NTSPGKINNSNWPDWAQMNTGTTLTIPSCKGATVSMEAFSDIKTTTIDGQSDYTSAKTISYEIANSAETIDVVIGDGSYYRYIQTVLPVMASSGGKTFTNEPASVIWNFNTTTPGVADTVTPPDGFSMTAANTGDLTITGTASRTADDAAAGVTFVKLKPAGTTQAVEWTLKPAAGLTFTPTKVSGWIQRFGTDAENGVTVTAKLANGTSIQLGNYTAPRSNKTKADDKFGSSSNYTNQFVIELTEAQQQALTSADGFSLFATVGVGSTKEGGFSDIHVDGLLNGTIASVNKYALTIVASPEEGGSVSAYPISEEYDEGSEVTLTATENFGYDFVNWTDAEGNVVSTEAKFKYTVESEAALTANFVAVNTYALDLTVDGTNDYMVEVNPVGTVVDGKMMYEEGVYVTLTANSYEGLVTFNNWSDGQTVSEITLKMDGDKEIAAVYSQEDIIAGWDFYKSGNSGRVADFYSTENEASAFTLTNGTDATSWLDKSTEAANGYESMKGAAVNWKTGSGNGDVGHYYWQTKVNAEAFTNIKVQFDMLFNYNSYTVYNVEYSTDGENWTGNGSITLTGAKAVCHYENTLPEDVNNQANLYIRMIPDYTSEIKGSASA
ncbi:MAG: hypothetical protein IIT94_10525, partial [Prevotella sp.]|nr:hypothetical protein [Prevotella sp.]